MRKKCLPVFVLVCLAVGVLFILLILGWLLPVVLVGVFRIIAIILVVIGLILVITLTAIWSLKDKEDAVRISLEESEDVYMSLQDCIDDIARYLRDNKSTPFFREKLNQISGQLESLQNRFLNIHSLLESRFDKHSLSYDKFSIPIDELKSYLMKLIRSLMLKMISFNEEEYAEKIERFRKSNHIDEAEGHVALEHEYKGYIESVVRQLDNVILKMDKLILEMSMLNHTQLEKAMGVLCTIDNTIKDTRLYK
jgi:hypothetical protein